MPDFFAAAQAHPNIAFIKYWGNRDAVLRIPQNGSLSMCLDGLQTTTTVRFSPEFGCDHLTINAAEQEGASLERVSAFLDRVRELAGLGWRAHVESSSNFPAGAGIASSASAFAALALAASAAAGLALEESALSRLARLGSGSACRSVPAGFVEWQAGTGDADSFAVSIAPPEHWDLVDMIVIVDEGHKPVGSSEGHGLAQTSALNALRMAGVRERLAECRQAVLTRDFARFAPVVEADSHWMHAVMRTSTPPLVYWTPATEVVLWHVLAWRKQGHALCASVDAGPNVHVLGLSAEREWAAAQLRGLPGVRDVLTARPGGGARLLDRGE